MTDADRQTVEKLIDQNTKLIDVLDSIAEMNYNLMQALTMPKFVVMAQDQDDEAPPTMFN